MAVKVAIVKRAPPPPPEPKKRKKADEEDSQEEQPSGVEDAREALENAAEWLTVAYERLGEIEEAKGEED